MNAKKKTGVAMPVPYAPTTRVGDSANVKLASAVTGSSVLMLTNVRTKEFAIGTPPAPTTLGPMYVPAMLAIRAMEITCVLT